MDAENEESLPAQLFREDEWRLLWWRVFQAQDADPRFPRGSRDIEWIAYAAEMGVRHWRRSIVRRLAPLVESASASEHAARVPKDVREMLDDFQHELLNPILALDAQDGPWQVPDTAEDPDCDCPTGLPTSVDQLMRQASQAIATRFWLQWQQYGQIDWSAWWVERHGRTRSRVPTLLDHVGFANYDLRELGLPIIETDGTGRFFIDLNPTSTIISLTDEALRERISAVIARHGFSPAD
ncbi:hypothetical protein Cs7R123_47840 [Catellatospora sp. TT07R-123]|uniref:hypothetical protein n=1 Tax=Catellatospora sp. TT07R-123 TaxID=2733863 RepID=UPI001AFE55F4|nr:hypothetical protein [Catellatospora sp. TT07R-123]GHJ47442.1 hypothetical protein Cs7R123_47840 [Catellatospora sp. TT07R-123]